ncbi:MAG: choice-of-anchor R domain-containing protein [Methylomonas sp.]
MKLYQKLGAIITMMLSNTGFAGTTGSLYDNFTYTSTYPNGSPELTGYPGSPGQSLNNGDALANEFTTSGTPCSSISCSVASVALDITAPNIPGISAPFLSGLEVQIYTDVNGALGTQFLTMSNPTTIFTSNTLEEFTSTSTLTLAPNANYWVVLSNGSTQEVDWWQNGQSGFNNIAHQPDQILYDGSPAPGAGGFLMQVEYTSTSSGSGATTPIPATGWMMGTALIGFAASRIGKSRNQKS